MVERLWALERRGRAADRDRRRLLHAGVADPGEGCSARRTPSAWQARDPRLGRLGARPAAAELEVADKVGSVAVHPTCATRHMGLAPRLRALAGALAEEVYVAALGDLLRLRRRPRHLPPGADRGGDRPAGRRARRPPLRRPPLQQPHLRDRPRPRHRRGLRVGADLLERASRPSALSRQRPARLLMVGGGLVAEGAGLDLADHRRGLRVALQAAVEQRVDQAAKGGDVAPPLRREDPRRPLFDPAHEAAPASAGVIRFSRNSGRFCCMRSPLSWSKAS